MRLRISLAAAVVVAVCSCSGASTTAANPTPTYVPAACAHASPAAGGPTTPSPAVGNNPAISTEIQLRIVDGLINVVDQVYLYPDFQGVDWNSIAADYRQKVAAGLDTQTFYEDMAQLVAALGDEHSYFLSPAQVAVDRAELAGANDFVGIGVVVLPLPMNGDLSVLEVFPGSPAERSGLTAHDKILAVNGRPIVDKGVAHPDLLRGPRCSVAVLTIQTPGKSARRIAVFNDEVTGPEPVAAQLVHTNDGSRIGYIFLPTFYDKTVPLQVDRALNDFGNLDGLILDDRTNTGGLYSVVEPVLRRFTSGTLGHFVSRTSAADRDPRLTPERPFEIVAQSIQNSTTVPLVVLVGRHTFSLGEVFAGILQDDGRAKLVGDTTAGHVEALYSWNFEDGSQMWIAEESFDPEVSHMNWEKVGVVPDVQVGAEWDTFTFETDPAVAAALQVLKHK